MKQLIATAAAATLVAGAAGAAQAQIPAPAVYGSVGYNHKEDSDLSSVQLRVGGRFGAHFGVEGELGLGVEPDSYTLDYTVPALQVKTQLRHEAAAYLVGYYPVTPNFDVFARLGYGTTSFKRTVTFPPDVGVGKISAESVNYGVGAQYFLDGRNGVRLDYTRQDFETPWRTDDTWSISYTRRF